MKMEGIELYPHNQKAYDNLCAMLRDSKKPATSSFRSVMRQGQ